MAPKMGGFGGHYPLDDIFYRLVDPLRMDKVYVDYAPENPYYLNECCYEPLVWLYEEYPPDDSYLIAGIDGVETTQRIKPAEENASRRKGARVTWGYINRILGQQLLIQVAKFSWLGRMSPARNQVLKYSTTTTMESKNSLGNVVLHLSLKTRIEHLTWVVANTKMHLIIFRNMFYGPPGTEKKMLQGRVFSSGGKVYILGLVSFLNLNATAH
ncbi:hypothetical protein V6N13_092169 [Hibiscus sabdariffa]